jgi:hypothetical protein
MRAIVQQAYGVAAKPSGGRRRWNQKGPTTWPPSSVHTLASTRRAVVFPFPAAATTSIW